MTYITDAKVLQYRMNHQGLEEELIAEGCKKLGGWVKEEGILDAYKKYIHKYVDFIYQNFTQLEIVSDPVHYYNLELAEKHIRNQEAMMQEHSQITSAQNEQSTQMLEQFLQMRELLQKIINVICNPNASANTILDMDAERIHTEKEFLNGFLCDNQRYAENFTSILFGEDDGSNIMESSPVATLSDVYISPKAIFSDEKEYPIEAIINQFASRKEHSLLTIYGKPGVGKSTLASLVLRYNYGHEMLNRL